MLEKAAAHIDPIMLVIVINVGMLLVYLFVRWFESLLPMRVRYSEESSSSVSRTGWAVAFVFLGLVAGIALMLIAMVAR